MKKDISPLQKKLEEYRQARREASMSPGCVTGQLPAIRKLGMVPMPEPEDNEVDIGSGARRALPIRYED